MTIATMPHPDEPPRMEKRVLLDHHRAQLHASGLTDQTIETDGIYSETNFAMLATLVNWKKWPKSRGPGLVFPYRSVGGELNGYAVVKPDAPRYRMVDGKPRPIKYEAPRGVPARVYIPHGTIEFLKDARAELIITEGQKKASAASQEGFPCLGLSGVFGFANKKTAALPAEFEYVEWSSRNVRIVFDSDLHDNELVQRAEARLAAFVAARGAKVKVARLPPGPNGEKVGLDDFLVAHGKVELRKLLDKAEDPEPEQGSVGKEPATQADPMFYADNFLRAVQSASGHNTLAYHRGQHWRYNGKNFYKVPRDDLRCVIQTFLDPYLCQLRPGAVSSILAGIESRVLVHARRDAPTWLDNPKRSQAFISMQNGILDVDAAIESKSDALLSHSPLWFSPVCLPYYYDPKAQCPHWLKVLGRCLEEDTQRIHLLQRWFGYCLVFSTDMHKFLLMTGDGGNGKSVVCAALEALLGSENVSHIGLELFAQRFQLTETLGKLANITAEVGDLDKLAEGYLKAFTSGDAMTFDQKHKDIISTRPTARLVLATNNLPRFSDRSGGIYRRMILLPFNVTISESEKIPGMDKPEWWERQPAELSGIFNWSLIGLRELRERGRFPDSDVCDIAREQFRIDCNPAREFLTDGYREHVEGKLIASEVYERYATWAKANGYRPLADAQFGKEVKRVFPKVQKQKLHDFDGKRKPTYVGVCEGAD